jgi:transglutaminase-like putative cysteine protease
MAREPDTPAGRHRLVALAAVAALAVATAVAFGRVFIGHPPTQKLVLAALASVAVGALFERRSLALAVVATAVGLALAITWLLFPQTTWFGVPTIRTLRALERSLDFVAQQARVQVAPAPPLPPLMLAALTAVWTASFSIHALAIRAGSPLLAVLPPVALVGFADTVLEDGARPTYALLFLAAVLAVVFVDGLRRVREWGPIWSSSRERRFGSSAMRGARIVAAVAVLAAVLAPGVLPGFRAAALVDLSTGNDDGIDLDPFVSIQNQLEQSDPVDLFEVTSPDGAAYWRLYALDLFDGLTWTSSDPLAKEGQVLTSPAQLSPGFRIDAPRLEQRVHVLRDVDESWLPMAYPPESIVAPLETFRYDADLGMAVVDGGLRAGLEYSVVSREVTPTPQELEAVRLNPDYGAYTFIPDGIDPRIAEVAERWTQDLSTPYEQVYAIQQHFQSDEFTYDQTVDAVADNEALVSFFRSKRGFCQQFATAMALLVRELGYPARVAVGFREGHADAQGDTYTVTSKDAHAWVEVYFGPDYGWLPFEPTPTRSLPTSVEPGTYQNPTAPGESGQNPVIPGQEGTVGPGRANGDDPCKGVPPQLCNADSVLSGRPGRQAGGGELPPGFFGPAIAAPLAEEDGYSIPYRWIGLALLALLLIGAIVVPIAKWTWRRRALRRSQAPRELVLAAVRVFDGEVADVGLGRRDGETLDEHRARLSATIAFSDGHLSRLTTSAMRAAYSPSEPSSADATEAVSDARMAASDVRRSVGIGRRLLGIYRPGM